MGGVCSCIARSPESELCRLITYEHWQSAIVRCKKNPKEAKYTDQDGCLPIHVACYRGAPLEVLQALHKAYGNGVKKPDNFGWLPIHIAVYHGAPREVIDLLNQLYPEGLKMKNDTRFENLAEKVSNGGSTFESEVATTERVPGMNLKKRESNERENVNSSLIDPQDYLDKTRENQDGWLPIHIACYQGAGLSVVKTINDSYPIGVSRADKHGWLPLHLACYHRATPEVIDFLLDSYPKGAKHLNEFKCLPVHLACESGADVDVIRLLVKAYPKGLKKKNYWDNLPIHRAIFQGNAAGAIRVMLEEDPTIIKIKNGDGETPMDVAKSVSIANKDEIIAVLEEFSNA